MLLPAIHTVGKHRCCAAVSCCGLVQFTLAEGLLHTRSTCRSKFTDAPESKLAGLLKYRQWSHETLTFIEV